MAQRNPAIDVLRGLTLALMIVVNMSVDDSYRQLQHSAWHGLTLTDVVFPTFLFVVGASLALTLGRYERQGEAALLGKVLRRTLLIFLCGYLLYWFPFLQFDAAGHLALRPLATTRIFGVLQRIRSEMEAGRSPGRELAHGVMILAAGFLLLLPGFVSDIVGLALFVPPIRDLAWHWLSRNVDFSTVVVTRGFGGAGRPDKTIDLDADDYRTEPDPGSPWRRIDRDEP